MGRPKLEKFEKDIGKIPKREDTSVLIRIDEYGGKRGLTIREYVENEKYTGFTRSGTRIPATEFAKFKELINSIDENDLRSPEDEKVDKAAEEAGAKGDVDWDKEEEGEE
jgi:hypothetical protein